MYTDSVYKDIFDEAGVTVLPREEVEKIIAEKEEQVGLTEEIRDGQQIEWTIIENNIYEESAAVVAATVFTDMNIPYRK